MVQGEAVCSVVRHACLQRGTDKLHMVMQTVGHQEGVLLCKLLHVVCKAEHLLFQDGTDIWESCLCQHFPIADMTEVSRAAKNCPQVTHVNATKLSPACIWESCGSQPVEQGREDTTKPDA